MTIPPIGGMAANAARLFPCPSDGALVTAISRERPNRPGHVGTRPIGASLVGGAARLPDWTSVQDYLFLRAARRRAFAWEWLRRTPSYRETALAALQHRRSAARLEDLAAAQWNLHAFEDPRLDSRHARPVWMAEADPFVLHCTAVGSAEGADSIDIARHNHLARVIAAPAHDRVLLSDGLRSIRLDIAGDRVGSGAFILHYDLFGVRSLERPLVTLRRLMALLQLGRFSPALFPADARARRLILMLRTFDALQAGASQRHIARILLDSAAAGMPRWRLETPSLRSQAQRLAASARRLAGGGFWRLLET